MSVTKLNNIPVRILRPRPPKDMFFNFRLVESSNIDRIGWPVTGEPLMLVRFKSGMEYAYLGVSRQRAVAAAYATSVGRYINHRIKGRFECRKIHPA
jgi:hypothetical protein